VRDALDRHSPRLIASTTYQHAQPPTRRPGRHVCIARVCFPVQDVLDTMCFVVFSRCCSFLWAPATEPAFKHRIEMQANLKKVGVISAHPFIETMMDVRPHTLTYTVSRRTLGSCLLPPPPHPLTCSAPPC
jgi:hypothetical protein